MERHHFPYAADFAKDLLSLGNILPSPCLSSSAATFFRNILRIQSLGRLPIILVGASVITQTYDIKAKSLLGISDEDVRITGGHPLFDLAAYREKEQLRKQLQMAWFEKSKRGEVASGMIIGEVNLANMIPAGGNETQEGIDAVLTGMITGMWTSYEVLLEQIWNAVVAERPHIKSSITNKEWKQAGLRSLLKVRRLFGYTFRVNEVEIFRILNDNRIDALALTRNLLIHTDGVIDTEFDSRRASIPGLNCFSSTQCGDKIQLTGNIVCNLLEPTVALGFDLLKHVDLWLIANP